MKVKFTFDYDNRGYGYLERYINNTKQGSWYARSGSCDVTGTLVNSISYGVWSICMPPVLPAIDDGDSMVVIGQPGHGWKARLWTPAGKWSRYLIHPDGGRPGTAGCIGIQGNNANDLYQFLLDYFTKNGECKDYWIPVCIGKHYFNSEITRNEIILREIEPKPQEEKVKILDIIKTWRKPVETVKPAKVAEKTASVGVITGISLLLANIVAEKIGTPVEATAAVIAGIIGGLVNLIRHPKKTA